VYAYAVLRSLLHPQSADCFGDMFCKSPGKEEEDEKSKGNQSHPRKTFPDKLPT
jgi:hypothetical protein